MIRELYEDVETAGRREGIIFPQIITAILLL